MRISNNSIQVIRFYDKLPPFIGDTEQLKQAFLNIITNAFQAMRGGGILTIKTNSRTNEKPLSLHVTFSDTGCGIPKEDINKIFTSFFTTKEDGIGLGLCIVERVIKAHGGRIEVGSVLNKGTTFNIVLPV